MIKYYSHKNEEGTILSLVIAAIFLCLTMIFKYIGNFIIIFGYGAELELIFYIIGLMLIPKIYYKIFFLILAPPIWIFISAAVFINPIQIFIEYILPQISFGLIIIPWELLKKSSKIKINIAIISSILLLFICKMFIHIIAGSLWYTNGDWLLSFIINFKIIFINFAIIMPLIIIIFNFVLKNKIGLYNYKMNLFNKILSKQREY